MSFGRKAQLFPEGQRLCLRAPEEADFKAYRHFFAEVSERAYYLEEALLPLNEAQLRTYVSGMNEGDKYLAFSLVEKAGGKTVGLVNLDDIDLRSRHAVLGIAITDPSARGQGFAKEGGKLMLAYAFGELNLHRVEISYMEGNDASRALFNSLGFIDEGCRRDLTRRGNSWLDMHIMSLLEEEYFRTEGDHAARIADSPHQ